MVYVFILGVFWHRKLNVTEFNLPARTLIDEFLEIERISEGSGGFLLELTMKYIKHGDENEYSSR